MKWNYVRLADVAPMPWRNGAGTTRELLAWPDARDWRVRVSVAEVASDGPFSAFPGVERWFAVLQGEGVRLDVDGTIHEVREGSSPLVFDGGVSTRATLIDGPTLDFNLMTRNPGAQLFSSSPRRRGPRASLAMPWIPAAAGMTMVGVYDLDASTLAWQIVDEPTPIEPRGNALCLEVPL